MSDLLDCEYGPGYIVFYDIAFFCQHGFPAKTLIEVHNSQPKGKVHILSDKENKTQ